MWGYHLDRIAVCSYDLTKLENPIHAVNKTVGCQYISLETR